jgi:hypothetical protein
MTACRMDARTWYFRMKDARVTSAIAFFDTREFDEFWNRVSRRRERLTNDCPISRNREDFAKLPRTQRVPPPLLMITKDPS